MPKEQIPLKKLKRLDELAQAAKQANDLVMSELTQLAIDTMKTNPELSAKFLDYADRFGSVSGDCYMLLLQGTWLGGPSDNPKNHSVREPNIVSFPSTFSRKEYEEVFGDI